MQKICDSELSGNTVAKAAVNICELLQTIIKQNETIIGLLGKPKHTKKPDTSEVLGIISNIRPGKELSPTEIEKLKEFNKRGDRNE